MVNEQSRSDRHHQKIWVLADDDVDMLIKGSIPRDVPEAERQINDEQLGWIDQLAAAGRIEKKFNTTFFHAGRFARTGTGRNMGRGHGFVFTLIITLLLCFPIGVAAAVYLEEFAPKNLWTDLIEVNINNLAAVPSIIFGLLGLAIFINFWVCPARPPWSAVWS